MQGRGEGCATGKDETVESTQPFVVLVDGAFEALGLVGGHAQPFVGLLGRADRAAKIRADVEEFVLDRGEQPPDLRGPVVGVGASGLNHAEPDRGVGLVHRAVGLHAKIRLCRPRAVAEAGRAVVAGLCVNLAQADHGGSGQMARSGAESVSWERRLHPHTHRVLGRHVRWGGAWGMRGWVAGMRLRGLT